MSREKGKPRIIRAVTGRDAKGRAKVARDKRTGIMMERVKARTTKPCTYYACPMGREITSDTEYAKVTRRDDMKRVGSRAVPDPHDFHFDCVPPEARPLVRLLVPMNWRALTVLDRDTEEVRWFTSLAAWLAWADRNHPDMRKTFQRKTNEGAQVGMNYYWSNLQHKPRFQKP